MINYVASITGKSVIQHLNEGKFFSFTIVGSRDFTGKDFESLYTRTCIQGNVSDEFLNIGNPQTGSSKDTHVHIKDVFASYEMEEVYAKKTSWILRGWSC